MSEEDLDWVKAALKKLTTRVVARNASTGIDVEAGEKSTASAEVSIDMEGFLKV